MIIIAIMNKGFDQAIFSDWMTLLLVYCWSRQSAVTVQYQQPYPMGYFKTWTMDSGLEL